MDAMKPLLAELAKAGPLSRAEAERAFDQMLSGEATAAQIGAFLMALRVRGETLMKSSVPSAPCGENAARECARKRYRYRGNGWR